MLRQATEAASRGSLQTAHGRGIYSMRAQRRKCLWRPLTKRAVRCLLFSTTSNNLGAARFTEWQALYTRLAAETSWPAHGFGGFARRSMDCLRGDSLCEAGLVIMYRRSPGPTSRDPTPSKRRCGPQTGTCRPCE